jgi:hypothetical protein
VVNQLGTPRGSAVQAKSIGSTTCPDPRRQLAIKHGLWKSDADRGIIDGCLADSGLSLQSGGLIS